MAAVHRIAAVPAITLGPAADAYLATLRGAEQAQHRRAYGRILRWVVTEFAAGESPDGEGSDSHPA
jgi:hypothetical protein